MTMKPKSNDLTADLAAMANILCGSIESGILPFSGSACHNKALLLVERAESQSSRKPKPKSRFNKRRVFRGWINPMLKSELPKRFRWDDTLAIKFGKVKELKGDRPCKVTVEWK